MTGDAVGRLYRWNTETGECLNEQHLGPVTAVAITEDGRHVLSGGVDATVRLWDLATGNMLRQWNGPGEIHSLAVNAAGTLAVASGKAILLRSIDGEARRDITTDSEVLQVLFADGETLISLHQDGTIRLWNIANGQPRQPLPLDAPAQRLALSPDGTVLAAAVGNDIHLRQFPSGSDLGAITGHTQPIAWLAFHPSGHQLASCAQGDDASVRLWDIDKREETERLEGHLRGARACSFRTDGNLLVTCGYDDGTLQLWDLFDARPRRKVLPVARTNVAALQGFALTPEGRYAVTAHGDGSLYVLRLAEPGEVLRVER
jgi:WD40 repeat protein